MELGFLESGFRFQILGGGFELKCSELGFLEASFLILDLAEDLNRSSDSWKLASDSRFGPGFELKCRSLDS
jgi:hypothetical protein